MNLQSLRQSLREPLVRAVPVLAILVILLVLIFLPRLDAQFFANARYERCSNMAASEPVKALAFARDWHASRPHSAMARHCEAVALFATRDYSHAAVAFTELAKETATLNPSLSAQLSQQASKAYAAAGQHDPVKTLAIDKSAQNGANSPPAPPASAGASNR